MRLPAAVFRVQNPQQTTVIVHVAHGAAQSPRAQSTALLPAAKARSPKKPRAGTAKPSGGKKAPAAAPKAAKPPRPKRPDLPALRQFTTRKGRRYELRRVS